MNQYYCANLPRPPISKEYTPYLVMTNMFEMEEVTQDFFEHLKNNLYVICKQFGEVDKVYIEENEQGNVWIKYHETEAAVNAQSTLIGKEFENNKIFVYFVTEDTYYQRVRSF